MRSFVFLVLLSLCVCISAHVSSLRPRQQAPVFTAASVVDGKFSKTSLRDFPGKWMILVFYPFDFTFVCPSELISFSERHSEFQKLGGQVLGISTDSHHTHLAWVKTDRNNGGIGEMKFPLLADISKQISDSYGVLVTEPDDDMYGAALRGLFIIDPKGIIRHIEINDDHVGRNVDETLRLLQAFQYADKNGQVCPANWKPGDTAMKPTPEGVKDYLKKKWGAKDL